MVDTCLVPVCLPEPMPKIAAFLIEAGWPEEAGPVKPVAIWLQGNGVRSKIDFVGLDDIELLPEADEFPVAAVAFLQTLVTSAGCNVVTWSKPSGRVGHAEQMDVVNVFNAPKIRMDLSAAKPSEALKHLEALIDREGRESWNKRARITAVLDNCPKSKASMHSGWFVVYDHLTTGWRERDGRYYALAKIPEIGERRQCGTFPSGFERCAGMVAHVSVCHSADCSGRCTLGYLVFWQVPGHLLQLFEPPQGSVLCPRAHPATCGRPGH